MDKVHLDIFQPQQVKLQDDFDHVIVPGIEGDFGISIGHTPFITMLRPGVISAYKGDKVDNYAIHDGFVTVEDDKVVITCQTIEAAAEIDAQRAKKAKQRAEKRLQAPPDSSDIDFRRAELALKRSLVRLSLKES
ncbi:MAG: F-type H+-transporting ATPase subunit epsilon [Candidatus Cloacimonadota bacterium]|jgi:F-type H+-transporting ATPase subunit epsilon|nr:F-type H+-transporting ATPase subunit epsilon [Candidatus Cloacimonadota bacterium]